MAYPYFDRYTLKNNGFLILILSLYSFVMVGQSDIYNQPASITFVNTEVEASDSARSDILRGQIFLILMSGIGPVIYRSDSIFEAQYKIKYFDHGCTGPDEQFISAYNNVMFDYLQNKYGKPWRSAVRKDVIGYKKWRKQQRFKWLKK